MFWTMIRPWQQSASARKMPAGQREKAAKRPACAWLPRCWAAMSAKFSLWRAPCGCASLRRVVRKTLHFRAG